MNQTVIPVVAASNRYYASSKVADHSVVASRSLAGLCDAIGTNQATIVLRHSRNSEKTEYVVGANLDLSAYTNITFQFERGAVLSHGAFTLNIPNVEAGRYQIFDGTGTVTLSGTVYPEWWANNAVPGTTDLGDAFVSALASLTTNYGEVLLDATRYKCAKNLVMPTRVSIKGQDKWNSRIEFAVSTSPALDLRGADTDNRIRTTIENLNIGGANCEAGVDAVYVNWNQQSFPLMRSVTINGGYVANGFRDGIVFSEGGDNWEVNFENVGIEGLVRDGIVINNQDGEGVQIINFTNCRIENNGGMNIRNDGGVTINIHGCTIQGAGYGGEDGAIEAGIYCDYGGLINIDNCWIEENAKTKEAIYIGPNTATISSGARKATVSLHNTMLAYGIIGAKVLGRLVLSGFNHIHSQTNCINIGKNGEVIQSGPVYFEPIAAATRVVDAAADGTNQYISTVDYISAQPSGLAIGIHQNGYTFTNGGATGLVQFTLPTAMNGLRFKFIRAASYQVNIVRSGSNTIRGSSNAFVLNNTGACCELFAVFNGTTWDWKVVNERQQGFLDITGATPALNGVQSCRTQNATATTMTGFTGGVPGDVCRVLFGDGNTTVDFSGTNLKGNAGVDWSPAQGDWMECWCHNGTVWYCSCHDTTA